MGSEKNSYFKRLHGLRVNAITAKGEINPILKEIEAKSGSVSAACARSALSAMFAWAVTDDESVDANPVINAKRFDGAGKRERVLKPEEIVAIWNALPDNDYGAIIKLLFYTGARRDEIGELMSPEFDNANRQIDLPAERSKNHRPFIMALSDPAFELLASRGTKKHFVFGQRDHGFQGWSKAKEGLDATLNFDKPWQLRDIRRTVATGMAELGVDPHIVEACLNHVSGHKAGVAGIYNKAAYASQKREAVERWATHLTVMLAQARGENVTPMKDRKRRA